MKKYLFSVVFICLILNLNAKDYTLSSPSGILKITVSVDGTTSYSVSLDGKEIISPSVISMTLDDGTVLGENAKVRRSKTTELNQEIIPVVNRKYAKIRDHYNLLSLSFKNYTLEFKAFNDGVAYRWGVEKKSPFKVKSEQATFTFPANHNIWFPEEESMFTHQERSYKRVKLSDVTPERFCSTGMLVDCGNNTKVYISESDLFDYPGMFLKGSSENQNALVSKHAGVVLETIQKGDRNVAPTKYADYIAECDGSRTFPWRAMVITNDAGLVELGLCS